MSYSARKIICFALGGCALALTATTSAMAARHGGTATLKTVEGEPLKLTKNGAGWWVVDAKGGKSRITIPNVMQSNGVIHVVDSVLMP